MDHHRFLSILECYCVKAQIHETVKIIIYSLDFYLFWFWYGPNRHRVECGILFSLWILSSHLSYVVESNEDATVWYFYCKNIHSWSLKSAVRSVTLKWYKQLKISKSSLKFSNDFNSKRIVIGIENRKSKIEISSESVANKIKSEEFYSLLLIGGYFFFFCYLGLIWVYLTTQWNSN